MRPTVYGRARGPALVQPEPHSVTSDKSETLPRLQPLPLSNEGLSRVTSEGHMKLLMRKWTQGLGHLSDPVSWTEIRFRLATLMLIRGCWGQEGTAPGCCQGRIT